MTRAEILAAINALVDKPSMASEIDTMLAAATLRMHQSDFYERDVQEQLVNLGSSASVFSFDAPSTFTRYRAIKYLRKYDPTTATLGKLLDKIDPERVINGYGVDKTNVYYAAGNNLVVKSSEDLQYMQCGWYANPDIAVATYSSWIADTVPHAIIFDACSLIFQMTAQQEQSRKFDALVQEQLVMVKAHGINSKGY